MDEYAILGYFGFMAGAGYSIFYPFREIVKRDPVPGSRFQITDLLAFFVSFQLGVAVFRVALSHLEWRREAIVAVSSFYLIVSGVGWLYGLRILWRTRIQSNLKRLVLLAIVMPFGICLPCLTIPALYASRNWEEVYIRFGIFLVLILILRFLSGWIANAEEPES